MSTKRDKERHRKAIVKKIGTVVDDPEDWLKTPNSQFGGRTPEELIGTPDEQLIHVTIEAAQCGFFS